LDLARSEQFAGFFLAFLFYREVCMTQLRPSKENVREYLKQRQAGNTPPPTPEEIRRQLGWLMEKASSTDQTDTAPRIPLDD
jgi:hypothetical protein